MARIDDLKIEEPGTANRPVLTLVGVNHRSASFQELEEAALEADQVKEVLHRIAGTGQIAEAAMIATCNRTEAYLVGLETEGPSTIGRQVLKGLGDLSEDAVFVKFGRDAVAHLCRVAAGIDSLMVGEVQILGQVKTALTLARETHAAGPLLGQLFAAAFRAGKRSRSETQIGQGAVSVSYAALGLAQKIFSDLSDRSLLLVGAGDAAALAGRHFVEAGVGSIVIANRSPERAARLAADLSGRAVGLDQVPEVLGDADVVVTATSSPEPVITRGQVQTATSHRSRPLIFIDIAMPRDVDAAVNDLDGVFVHDMGALESIVQKNLERRRREIPKVEAIVAEEVERHQTWEKSLEAGSTIRDLRGHFETIRGEELAKLQGKVSETDFERLERVTRAIVNRLLHTPTTRIRRPREEAGNPITLFAAVREIFALDAGGEDEDPDARSGARRRRR
jgi:glutamyl-tRNA reductase